MRKWSFKKFLRQPNLRLFLAGLIAFIFFGYNASSADGKPSPYKQRLQHYAKGEFDKAIQDLQIALKKKPSKSEKTKIYKYIGISLYTLGRKPEAEKNFEQCIAHDNQCSIDRSEALDESVLPFFQEIRRRTASKAPVPQPKTKILVKTPVKDAEILLDGILLGPVNTSLDAKPGTREITIQAKGYRARRVKIAVTRLVENVYEIQLDKLPPKVDPKEKARQAKLAAQAKAQEKEELRKKSRDKDKAKKLEARKAKELREREIREAREAVRKEKIPPVLPTEDALDENMSEGRDAKKDKLAKHETEANKALRKKNEELELPEDKGPPTSVAEKTPEPAPPSSPVELTKEPISVLHFFPLGVGQFYNGDFLLGTVFLGTQLYTAGVIVVATQDIKQAEANQAAAARKAKIDPTVTQDDIDAFTAAKNSFVKEKKQRIELASGILAGTYVFGVLHALIMRPYGIAPTASLNPEIPAAETKRVTWQILPNQQSLQLEMHWDF